MESSSVVIAASKLTSPIKYTTEELSTLANAQSCRHFIHLLS